MTADTIAGLLANDDLDAGIASAAGAVKNRPQDPKARMVLAELCVLAGDLERAETHAKLAARAAPDDAVGLGVFRQHLRGLHARDQWWQDGAVPAFPNSRRRARSRGRARGGRVTPTARPIPGPRAAAALQATRATPFPQLFRSQLRPQLPPLPRGRHTKPWPQHLIKYASSFRFDAQSMGVTQTRTTAKKG